MKTFFITLIYLLSLNAFAQKPLSIAQKKVNELKAKSIKVHGASLNRYHIKDLNNDGVDEIIESINNIERKSPGFLNIQLYRAFEYVKIYTLKNGEYVESYTDFEDYLEEKQETYFTWKNYIRNPEKLSTESQDLIARNKPLFLKELNRLITYIDEKLD